MKIFFAKGFPYIYEGRENFNKQVVCESFLQWLATAPDEVRTSIELWEIYKKNNQLTWVYWEDGEAITSRFSVDQAIFIIKQLLLLKKFNHKVIIFLCDQNKCITKTFDNKTDTIGFAYDEGKISEFKFASIPLTPLSYLLKSDPFTVREILETVKRYTVFSNERLHIEYAADRVTIEHRKHNNTLGNAGRKIVLPYQAFIWIVETYSQLIQEPFEQMLFYRTSEQCGFIQELDKEYVFEFK